MYDLAKLVHSSCVLTGQNSEKVIVYQQTANSTTYFQLRYTIYMLLLHSQLLTLLYVYHKDKYRNGHRGAGNRTNAESQSRVFRVRVLDSCSF